MIFQRKFNTFRRHTRHALPRISVHIALFWKPSEVFNYPASSQFFSDRIVFHDQKPPSTYFRGKKNFFCAKKNLRLFRARSKISENFPRAKSRKTDASWEFWSAPWTPNDARWNFTPRSKILSARSKIFKARRSAQHAPQTSPFVSADHFRKSSFHYNCFYNGPRVRLGAPSRAGGATPVRP